MGGSNCHANTGGRSNEALVVACSRGDSAALGALFTRFQVPVRQFLARHIGSGNPDRDDLAQATFVEVMRAAPRFRQDAAVQTWIFGIARNVVRHYHRREARRQLLSSDAEGCPVVERDDPETSAARSELALRLDAVLAMLPEELRTVFLMCELQEIPAAEVARMLHLSQGALWRRLHAAAKLLRKSLATQPE